MSTLISHEGDLRLGPKVTHGGGPFPLPDHGIDIFSMAECRLCRALLGELVRDLLREAFS